MTLDLHVYLHTPTPIFKARINMASAVYPVTELTFDGVTLGAYTDIEPDSTLLLGSTDGGDDLGRVRVQNVATATTIPVGRISEGVHDGELDVLDNAYITVWDDFRVWSKIPFIDAAGIQYKDSTVPVGTYTTEEPPVANCGPGFADYIDDGTSLITVTFAGGNSFAVADGATIVTYAWDVADGTITVGTSADATITATFPAGFRWVTLTVVDSNDTPHTARCPVLAVDPDDDVTLQHVVPDTLSITPQGQRLTLRVVEDLPQATYPDGTLVLFWDGTPATPGDRAHMQFIGWVQSDEADVRSGRTGHIAGTTLECVDVAGRLDSLPGFPQSLERAAVPVNWDGMVNPTMDKYIHYLLLWHSTALGLADYFASNTGDDYPFVIFRSDGQSLFEQVQNEARALVPTHQFTCNRRGQLRVIVDPILLDAAERTVTVQATFTEDYTESIRFVHTRPPRTHWLRGHALLTATDYTDVEGVDTLLTVHCIAPGTAPGQGLSESETSEGLARSQVALNAAKGHEYARLNARFGLMSITPPDDANYALVEPATLEWVNVTVTAATAAQRGFTWTNQRTQCKSLTFRFTFAREGTLRRAEFVLELETVGKPALTEVPVGTIDVTPTAPDFGLVEGVGLVAGVDINGNVYRTSDFQTPSGSGGPTWDSVATGIVETLYSFVVDPFSPGYILGAGTIDGWVASEDAIYRLGDLFGGVDVTEVFTFPVTAVAASFHWRSIQASFGRFFGEGINPWLLCISYYGDTAGHEGTWATYSLNGGATWADEVLVSEFYDTATATRFNPIGVYTSPKTPGLAYTAAFTETASPALADGYVSTDWGETWTRVSASPEDDPILQLPFWGQWNYETSTYSAIGLGGSATIQVAAESIGSGPEETDQRALILAPPADAKRVTLRGIYSVARARTDSPASASTDINIFNATGTARTDDLTFVQPAFNTVINEEFDLEWTFATFATNDWPVNRDSIQASPPTSVEGCRVRAFCFANGSGSEDASADITLTLRVLEIELDDGTIYTPPSVGAGLIQPGHAQAGSIHLPWPDNATEQLAYFGYLDKSTNREFRLKESVGGVITDISPSDGTRNYGVNKGLFTIRSFDNDRTYVVASVIGNDTSADPADDLHGIFVSDNEGATWAVVVTPIADTGAPSGRPAYEAAFAGDTQLVLFVWGPADTIGYSSDFGATLDDRSGNLSGASGYIGIAGGPTG